MLTQDEHFTLELFNQLSEPDKEKTRAELKAMIDAVVREAKWGWRIKVDSLNYQLALTYKKP